MSEDPELLGRVRDIDGATINAAVADARRTMVRVNSALEQVMTNGLEVSTTIPPTWKWIGGKVFSFRVRIAKE